MKIHEKEEKILFGFDLPSGIRKNLLFPKNISVSEMIKAAFSKLSLNSKNTRICNMKSLNLNSSINLFDNYRVFQIQSYNIIGIHGLFGKKIKVLVKVKGCGNNTNITIITGLLNSTLQLIDAIETNLCRNVIKLFYKDLILTKNYNKSLASLGINEDFHCEVELDNKNKF